MAEENANKYKVLIVDDDEFLLNMYSIKFRNSGLDVMTSSSPVEALQKLKEGLKPDVLILDIVMPGMDGFELLTKIREEKLAQGSIVLILTNQGQSSDMDKAKELGVASYIVKASTIPSEVLAEIMKAIKEAKK
jgi:CheY-like chemotaxis protein